LDEHWIDMDIKNLQLNKLQLQQQLSVTECLASAEGSHKDSLFSTGRSRFECHQHHVLLGCRSV